MSGPRRSVASRLTSIRGRVTMLVLAVTACLYSLLGTIGFVLVAHNGRDTIRQRVTEVVGQLETGLRNGSSTVRIVTPDGVEARATVEGSVRASLPADDIVVERTVTLGGVALRLVGHASQARLADSLHSLWLGVWIGVPLAAIITAAMAGVATGRALRPVDAIAGLADTIGANDTGTRVPTPDTGDEIEHLARTVNGMLDRLAMGRRAQQQFTSDAAHELRTPLMALQCEIEIAGASGRPADHDLLSRLDALADRLGARIDDLVLLSTLDEDRPRTAAPVALLDLVRTEAEPHGSVTVGGDDVVVTCDRALVARAVRNLLANAVRHAGTEVRATVAASPERVEVHVDDDGPGVPPAARDRIFDRFARLDEARSSDAGGAGLGLAIVASVAAAHHGGVAVTDGPLGGARLTLWFPV